ncbi:MAG: arginyltransferase [Formosimonas sp.]
MSETLQLFQTDEYACSYLPEQRAQSLMVSPVNVITPSNYSALLHLGFRRSGLHVYRPNCAQCQACTSLRIDVNAFSANRSQRRTHKKWQHLTVAICELDFNPEHFALYQHYQRTRHSDSSMANDDAAQYRQFLLTSRVDSFLVEFRNAEQQLLMVSLIDRIDDGLSAVYTFYDPAHSGLGTYNILWQIQTAQQLNLSYAYLGYWIAGSQKMAYKGQFAAAQVLKENVWQAL